MNIKLRFDQAMADHGPALNHVASDIAEQIAVDPELRREAAAIIVAIFRMELEDQAVVETVARLIHETM